MNRKTRLEVLQMWIRGTRDAIEKLFGKANGDNFGTWWSDLYYYLNDISVDISKMIEECERSNYDE